MDKSLRPRCARATVGALAPMVAALMAGCQSFESVPLDLEGHSATFENRLGGIESISGFVDRLSAAGWDAPDRFDLNDGLLLAEGEALALFFNADLRRARTRAGVALATAETAGLWDDPVLGFDGAQILSPGNMLQYGVTLGLTLPVSGRLAVERARAGEAYEAELRSLVEAEWSTRAELRRAWAAWSAATERVVLLAAVIAGVDEVVGIAGGLEDAGELSRVEARLLRVEAAGRRSELAEAQLSEATARMALLGLMGLPGDASVGLVAALGFEPIDRSDDPVQRLISANPTLAVYRARYQTAEESLRLEVRKQYPDITIGAGYGDENDDRLLLGVSLPIPSLNANRGGIARARAERDAARVEAHAAFERLSRELLLARHTLESIGSQRQAFETEIVPMLDEQTEELDRLASLGELDTLLLLETVTRGYDAKARLLDLRRAEAVAAITLAELLGPETVREPAPVSPADASRSTPSVGGGP